MRRALGVVGFALLGASVWAGCPEARSHIYAAELYNPDADCLFPGTVIDVVPGPPPDDAATTCDAICITDLDGDVYLSGMCPPLPEEFNLTGKAPGCEAAFAAHDRCRQCPIEAGKVMITCDAGAPEAGLDSPM